jgi:hypothetical protein
VIDQGATTAVTTSEDASPVAFALTLSATDPDAGDTLSWSIPTPAANGTAAVSVTPTGAIQTISYSPNTDFNGSDSFVVAVDDGNAGNAGITVNVTIDPVNDAPLFTLGPDQIIDINTSGLQTVTGFAGNIAPGPATATDEAGQLLTFSLTVIAGDLTFSSAPAIDPVSGNLTYAITAGSLGSAAIQVILSDDGGSASGGQDSSAAQTFVISNAGIAIPALSRPLQLLLIALLAGIFWFERHRRQQHG